MIAEAHCVVVICSENDTVPALTRISILYVSTVYINWHSVTTASTDDIYLTSGGLT